MAGDVADEILLLAVGAAEDLPQRARLHEILVGDGQLLRDGGAGPFLMLLAGFDGLVGHVAVGGRVVGVGAIVAVDGHDAIALVGVESPQGLVDGDLLVVDAQTVAVGVRVAEQAGLEDRIRGGLDAGDHVRGREGDLFDLGEVVFRVLVEDELAKRAEGHFALRPDFGEVEDIPSEFLGLFGREHLQIACPGRVVAILNRVKEVLGMEVGVFGGHLAGFVIGKGFATQVGFAVNLDVVKGAIGLGELVCVARVAVHVAVGIRGATVREEMHHLMGRFLVSGQIVPKHGGLRGYIFRSR